MRLTIFFVLVMANMSMTVQGQNHFSLDSAFTIPGSTVDIIVRLENQSPVQGFQCAITWDSTLFSFSDTNTDGTDIEQILSYQPVLVSDLFTQDYQWVSKYLPPRDIAECAVPFPLRLHPRSDHGSDVVSGQGIPPGSDVLFRARICL